MIQLDGSEGEGGGQILRSALALSLWTGQPFRIERIRARRPKPGLLRQHLTAVQAAVQISSARVEGAEVGSSALTFHPGEPKGGDYVFRVGTAGSTSLVLQTVLVPLLLAGQPSRLTLEGGTHNPFAPPFDFLAKTFVPVLRTMGVEMTLKLERHGFYPAGGGRVVVELEPWRKRAPLSLLQRGATTDAMPRAVVSGLDGRIAVRELDVLCEGLGLPRESYHPEVIAQPQGPGNVVMVELGFEHITEVLAAFGERGLSAEAVAARVMTQVRRYLASTAPVGEHLCDQLLLPCLAAGGEFLALPVSSHARTNIGLLERFVGAKVKHSPEGPAAARLEMSRVD